MPALTNRRCALSNRRVMAFLRSAIVAAPDQDARSVADPQTACSRRLGSRERCGAPQSCAVEFTKRSERLKEALSDRFADQGSLPHSTGEKRRDCRTTGLNRTVPEQTRLPMEQSRCELSTDPRRGPRGCCRARTSDLFLVGGGGITPRRCATVLVKADWRRGVLRTWGHGLTGYHPQSCGLGEG